MTRCGQFFSIIIMFLILITSANPLVLAADQNDLFTLGLKKLESSKASVAYRQFIQIYQIVSPHPDSDTEAFIQRANKGESDSFALIAYYIWSGYAGFRENKLAGKTALARAMKDGSSQAPFWIAQTFFQVESSSSDKERADNFFSGIQWLGVSAGMGESRSHDKAMNLIDDAAKGDQNVKLNLMALYNMGLEESKQYKKTSTTKKMKKQTTPR
jgi:hypothetical protein